MAVKCWSCCLCCSNDWFVGYVMPLYNRLLACWTCNSYLTIVMDFESETPDVTRQIPFLITPVVQSTQHLFGCYRGCGPRSAASSPSWCGNLSDMCVHRPGDVMSKAEKTGRVISLVLVQKRNTVNRGQAVTYSCSGTSHSFVKQNGW
jgi:hypothetical protein